MRWFNKDYPTHGQRRIKKWFAILPVTIGLQTRWFEYVTVEQIYFDRSVGKDSFVYINYISRWNNQKFIDND